MTSRAHDTRRAAESGFAPSSRLDLQGDELELLRRVTGRERGLVLVVGRKGSGRTTAITAAATEVANQLLPLPPVFDGVERAADIKRMLDMARTRLVLASIEANDGTDAFGRIVERGIDHLELTERLWAVFVVRLARTLCPRCVERYDPTWEELEAFGLYTMTPGALFSRGRGCTACKGTGRHGKTAIVEILVRPLDGLPPGRRAMRDSALEKVLAGVISTEEALAVLGGAR